VKRGDVLLATIYFRTQDSQAESGEGEAEFVFELARHPWTKSVQHPLRAGSQWEKISIPFVAVQDHPVGDAHVSLRLGFAKQIVEIGGLSVENFKTTLALADLPRTKISYEGMTPDASWRKPARERIDRIRKAQLRVIVVDGAGKPVQGASVHTRLIRHAFGFGTCVPAKILVSDGHVEYKKILSELFNVATLENDLKWPPLCGDWGRNYTLDRAKQAGERLQDMNISIRGHTLVWPSWRHLPRDLPKHANDSSNLRLEVQRHVQELVTAMKGRVVHWDVVNEPFDNHELLDILGSEVMIDWFKEARTADPAAKLFINDFGILSGGGGNARHRDHYENTIYFLMDRGAPLDAIGMQGHFRGTLTSIDDMLAILDRFAEFQKPIWVTEYDVVIGDEEAGGRFTHDFYTAMFSHPAIEGIVMWGFWDGAHHKGDGVMYRRDWYLKPAGKILRELLLQSWHTDVIGTTDSEGTFTTRGFLGEYDIEVGVAGKVKSVRAQLKKTGADVVLVLS
jgi:endo-1,4-beta-xylanase